jgi:hypothetical protein
MLRFVKRFFANADSGGMPREPGSRKSRLIPNWLSSLLMAANGLKGGRNRLERQVIVRRPCVLGEGTARRKDIARFAGLHLDLLAARRVLRYRFALEERVLT